MGKKRSLSEAQRAQIVILRQDGFTERAISERLAVCKTAVEALAVCEKIQRLYNLAMVQNFVFLRNNNSAVCLEEENCEETSRNSVQ